MRSSVPRMVALVRSDTTRGVATLTLDSPDNRNALSSRLISELLDALHAALEVFELADELVRVDRFVEALHADLLLPEDF